MIAIDPSKFLPNPADIPWRTIPGGTYERGAISGRGEVKIIEGRELDTAPVKEVTIPTFQLSISETTVASYRICVDAGACTEPNTDDSGYCNWGVEGRDRHPVNCVTWHQARAFAEFAGGRLPTEAEWEYAGRDGGQDRAYPWGRPRFMDCHYAVADFYGLAPPGCDRGSTWPVCSKGWKQQLPSFTFGETDLKLCDLIGSVEEWVEDAWIEGEGYLNAPVDGSAHVPEGWTGPRVLRGGGWYVYHHRVIPYVMTDAYGRHPAPPDHWDYNSGFRVARDLPEPGYLRRVEP